MDDETNVGGGRGKKWIVVSVLLGLALIGTGLGVGLGIDWDKGGESSSSSSSSNVAIDDGTSVADNSSPTSAPASASVESNSPTSSSSSSSSIATTTIPTSTSICPPTLDATYEIDDGITLHYAIYNGMFCARVTAKNDGSSWMGFGFSPDGLMDGSVAVIGVPGNDPPLKYRLTSSAIVMDDDEQTLPYAKLYANDDDDGDGYMSMEFAKILEEEGEVFIIPNAENRMIYAMGDGDVGYHYMRTSFVIDLASSVDDDTTTVTTTSTTVAAASIDDTIVSPSFIFLPPLPATHPILHLIVLILSFRPHPHRKKKK